MSYEGYEDIYCINGHYVDTRDAYDYSNPPECCPVCGEDSFVYDCVDLTNGCTSFPGECTDPDCRAHPRIDRQKDIVGYTMIPCPECSSGDHPGFVKKRIYTDFSVLPCPNRSEDGSCAPNCPKCFGYGEVFEATHSIVIRALCDTCLGAKWKPVPCYDVSKLKCGRAAERGGDC